MRTSDIGANDVVPPNEGDIVDNAIPRMVYQGHSKDCGFVWTVFVDDEGRGVGGVRRKTKITAVIPTSVGSVRDIIIKKFVKGQESSKIEIGETTVAGIMDFLEFVATTDFAIVTGSRIPLPHTGGSELSPELQDSIRQLILGAGQDGENIIRELLNQGAILSHDLVNFGYRREQLDWFRRMMNEPTGFQGYAADIGINDSSEEKVWQVFFAKNPWIFGYGLDYRYRQILQREWSAGSQTLAGQGNEFGDFLLGDNKFTTFVEIKKPSTPLFGSAINRSGAWKLSNDLLDAFSQILEQKAAGELRFQNVPALYDDAGNAIFQRPVDSKVVLIIGRWDTLQGSEQVRAVKTLTFERFRRDSRNVEIITYDELFERAQFIVEGGSSSTNII